MTQIVVSSGTTVVSTQIDVTTTYLVEGSGTLDIVNGGSVSGLITVSGGGMVILEAGGSVTHGNTTVSSGGTFEIIGLDASGYGVTFLSGATVELGSGATRTKPYILSAGVTGIVLSGGADANSTILSGATAIIESGGTLHDVTVSNGGILNVAGEVLSDTLVLSGGVENVSSGGFISGVTGSGTGISAGGIVNILAGGSAVHVGVSSGGTFNVAGTVLSNVGVYVGGIENVLAGGFTSGVSGSGTGVSGGTLNVSSGGLATFVGVSSGGIENISSGGVGESSTDYSSGITNVLAGGTADHFTVSSGGTLNVAGTTLSFVTVSSGGVENVLSGGLISGITNSGTGLSAGGVINILAGGSAAHIGVSSGGILNVAGTVLSNVGVYVGGIENVLAGGFTSGVTGTGTGVSGGTLNVSAGGLATFVGVSSGGIANVSSGGSLAFSTDYASGITNILAGGTAHDLTVSSGGRLNVAGTIISNVLVSGGGIETVSSGGFISGQLYSGSGDYGTGVQGTLNILAGGSAAFVGVSSGGIVDLFAGGSAFHVGVSSGGILNVAGTVQSNGAVYSGGIENVLAGGFTSGVSGSGTGVSGGTLNVSSGGLATFIGVSSGGVENISSGGAGQSSTDYFSGITNVLAGGKADHFTVSSGGTLNVAGTTLSVVTVSSGGVENVLSGGLISGVTSSGTGLSAGGIINIQAGGSAAHIGVSSGGILNVAGTVLSNVGVYVGGVENVLAGGFTSGVTGTGTGVSGGTLNVSAGGLATFVGVSSGGIENISSGGVGKSSTDYFSGITNVLAGGNADHFTVSSGGTLNVAGTVLSNVAILTGGIENVLSGGLISGAPSSGTGVSGGILNVASGGSAAFVGVSSGGTLNLAGSTLGPVTVFSGGTEYVSSGGVANGTVINGGKLELAVGASLGSKIVFSGTGGTLQIDDTTMPGSTISGLSAGDKIDLAGVTFVAGGSVHLLAGNVLAVTESSTTYDLQLDPSANFTGEQFNVTGDSGTGTNVNIYVDHAPVSTPTAASVTATHGQTSVTATSLFTTTDPDGDTIVQYALWDTGGSGHWSVNGVAQSAGVEIDITAAQWAQTTYVFGAAATKPDLLYVKASDGSLWGTWTSAVTANPPPDQAPVSTPVASSVTATHGQTSVTATSLFTATDADGDTIVQYALWDGGGSGHWSVNGVAQSAGVEIDITAAQWAQTSYVFGGAGTPSDLLYVKASDGSLWGAWTSAVTANPFADHAPVSTPTAASVTATRGQTSVAASSLFGVTDADGDTIVQYALWDGGGSGHWSVNGVAQSAGVEIDITAAQWAQTSYVFGGAGTASDLLYVKASDGSLWGAWTSAVTASPFADHAPVSTPTAASVTATHGQTSVPATSLFGVTDADGDTIVQYALWDGGGSGHWSVNGVAQSAGVEIDITAAQWAQTTYVFGAAGTPSDLLYVKASDGSLWGAWTSAVTASPFADHAPVSTPTAASVTATHGQTSIAATSLFGVTDADGDTIVQYALWDGGGSGHWSVNGVAQSAGVEIDITAAQWAQTTYVFGAAGTPSDLLYVKASDGSLWGAWTSAVTANPPPDQAPVSTPTAASVTATHGQTSVTATSLFTATDPDGDTIVQYALWDGGGSGHWSVNGVAQSAGVEIDITAAQWAQTSYVFGAAATKSDLLYVKASDGSLWGAWTSAVTANPPPDQAPVSTPTAPSVTATHGQTSVTATSLFTTTDPDGDTIVQYALWDTGGSGHWSVNGVAQSAGVEIDITAAQWAQTSYVFGAAATKSDLLYVKASDGSLWGAWTSAVTANPPPDHAPVSTPTAPSVTATHGQTSVAATSLFGVTDADGDTIMQYALWDTGGSGHWSVNGVAQSASVEIDITAAQWAQTSYVFGAAGTTSDLLYVKASDGSLWGTWTSAVTANPPPDHAPVVTAANAAIASGHSVAASSLFTASDSDGDTLTTYAFWDSNTNGHFSIGGVAQSANTEIDVTAAQLAQTSYLAGSGTDQLYVRASDGSLWSNWQAFTGGPVAPMVTASNLTTVPGQTLAASNLFTVSDSDGGTLTTYAFWDSNSNGHFTVGGAAQTANTEIDVTPAQLATTAYVSSSAGTDQLYVRVNEGTVWSTWQPFTATGATPANISAGATLELGSSYTSPVTFLAGTGTLKLDNSASFSGTVAGMTAADAIDLDDISFASETLTLQNETSSGVTLHVTDGTHIANIALLGNYIASTFVASSDGHGGTLVVDPPLGTSSQIATPASTHVA